MKLKDLREQYRLLRKSRTHWDQVKVGREGPYAEDCPLCERYIGQRGETCSGCPIAEDTCRVRCEGTRWAHARDAWEDAAARGDMGSRWCLTAGEEQAIDAFRGYISDLASKVLLRIREQERRNASARKRRAKRG